MKHLNIAATIAPAALTVALAVGMVGCASSTGTGTSDASNSEQATSQEAVASAADNQTSASASEQPGAASSSSTGEASASSSSAAKQGSSAAGSSSASASGKTGKNGNMGGMNAMDTQPGQTTDKGYTANDNGIAISATLNTAEAFTERDLAQDADTSSAQALAVADGKDINITEEGVYVISGTASESTIVVDAPDTAKVQIVLDGVSITNADFPAIYVKSADKVFVTLAGENNLTVTGAFVADGETNTNAVIFSKDDLCLNGSGSLTIDSSDNAIEGKDDLKVTGGTYRINAAGSALRANDSVRIAGGTFTIDAADGLKAKNDDDNELGYVYIADGTFTVNTTDNCIQGYAFVQIDGGTMQLNGAECIEGTYIQVNGGKVDVNASDDGINASIKSSIYTPTIEITGGEVNANMGSGDTDALDSNGYIYITGGTVNIEAQFAFDYAWGAKMTGGEVFVNGQQVNEITESMMGGMGGMGGQMPEGFDSSQMPTPPNGEMPEGMTPPDGEFPEGMTPPDGQAPEGQQGERPQRPDRGGSNGSGSESSGGSMPDSQSTNA